MAGNKKQREKGRNRSVKPWPKNEGKEVLCGAGADILLQSVVSMPG